MRLGISSRDAAVAMTATFSSRCQRHDVVPVEALTGEVVAAICTVCLDEVPMAWIHGPQPPPPPPLLPNPGLARGR